MVSNNKHLQKCDNAKFERFNRNLSNFLFKIKIVRFKYTTINLNLIVRKFRRDKISRKKINFAQHLINIINIINISVTYHKLL